MTTPDEDILDKLNTHLEANAGVASVNVDGQQITFDQNALDQRDRLARRVASKNGTRPRVSQIYMGGGP